MDTNTKKQILARAKATMADQLQQLRAGELCDPAYIAHALDQLERLFDEVAELEEQLLDADQ